MYFNLPLNGKFQINNFKTAITLLNNLESRGVIKLNAGSYEKGLNNIQRNTGYSYRFQSVSKNPTIILDVSHNAEGLGNLKENLKGIKYEKLYIIFGMMADKEVKKCINELEKLNGFMIFTKPEYKRAGEPKDFADHLSKGSKYVIKDNVKKSFIHAKSIAKKDDLILVTGSFFMVSDFLKFYKRK